ncbi:hypothetical protein L207DRAFT_21238 [Hyaloscypha variabilis F]|uniref:Uncharacterized protein n=1 Tax=Hyaloscypha variabilis (strain UAMH 11265 / GT02V1 / F) TaxID=1149755 RepID=A0A2J6RLJ3_HYAVF|nr:hypothetical protein L207DRAFT_21238 [Hyaloscypha variabilis F]
MWSYSCPAGPGVQDEATALARIGRDERCAEMSSGNGLLWVVAEGELTNTGARETERYTSQFTAGDSSRGGNAAFWGWNMEDRECQGARRER